MGEFAAVEIRYSLGDLYAIGWRSWLRWLKLLGWFVGLLLLLQIGLSVLAGQRFIDALSEIDFYFLLPLVLVIVAFQQLHHSSK